MDHIEYDFIKHSITNEKLLKDPNEKLLKLFEGLIKRKEKGRQRWKDISSVLYLVASCCVEKHHKT